MKPVQRYVVPDRVVSEVLDDGAVLLNLDSGIYFTLNATGTRMWQLLGEHGAVAPVHAALQSEFDVEPEQLARDLDGLVEQLVAKGLLEACGDLS